MPRSVTIKSPLHPSALRLKDLTRNRRITIYHIDADSTIDGVVVGESRLGYDSGDQPLYDGEPRTLVIDIMHKDGHIGTYDLYSLGVITDEKREWTPFSFVVDQTKKHLIRQDLGPANFHTRVNDDELWEMFVAGYDESMKQHPEL